MKVVSRHTIVAKGERITPGRIVDVEDEKEAKSLIRRGLARQPTEEDEIISRKIEKQEADALAEPISEEEAEDVDVSEMNRDELEARAAELEIDTAKIKGTGKNGRVLNADLVKAIEKAEKGAPRNSGGAGPGAAAPTGTTAPGSAGTPANPSLA